MGGDTWGWVRAEGRDGCRIEDGVEIRVMGGWTGLDLRLGWLDQGWECRCGGFYVEKGFGVGMGWDGVKSWLGLDWGVLGTEYGHKNRGC